MPLQNRVDPFGDIHAVEARGMFTGNRGGAIHDPATKTLLKKRWANKSWIICTCDYKGRRREVMGRNGPNGGAGWTDREALKAGFKAIHAVFDASQHIVSGHAILFKGETAACLSHVNARFIREIDGQRAVFASTGWYDDKLVRTPEGWRICERLSRMVTASGDLRVMQAMPGVDTNYAFYALAAEAAAGRVAFFGR